MKKVRAPSDHSLSLLTRDLFVHMFYTLGVYICVVEKSFFLAFQKKVLPPSGSSAESTGYIATCAIFSRAQHKMCIFIVDQTQHFSLH